MRSLRSHALAEPKVHPQTESAPSAAEPVPPTAAEPDVGRSPGVRGHRPTGNRWWRRAGLAAAGVAAIVVIAGGGGYLAGRHAGGTPAVTSAQAALETMPGGPRGAAGRAVVRSTSQGTELNVSTSGLPLREGYYEVWLFDPDVNQMVAVGTLAANGDGAFPVPPGLDPHRYHVVDVSAQNFDGNPVHQQSVLRGALRQ